MSLDSNGVEGNDVSDPTAISEDGMHVTCNKTLLLLTSSSTRGSRVCMEQSVETTSHDDGDLAEPSARTMTKTCRIGGMAARRVIQLSVSRRSRRGQYLVAVCVAVTEGLGLSQRPSSRDRNHPDFQPPMQRVGDPLEHRERVPLVVGVLES